MAMQKHLSIPEICHHEHLPRFGGAWLSDAIGKTEFRINGMLYDSGGLPEWTNVIFDGNDPVE